MSDDERASAWLDDELDAGGCDCDIGRNFANPATFYPGSKDAGDIHISDAFYGDSPGGIAEYCDRNQIGVDAGLAWRGFGGAD